MMKKRRISWDAPYSHDAPGWVIAHHQELDDNNIAAMCINFAVAAFILCGPGDAKMAWVDRQTIGQLKSMVDSSYELTSLLTLMLASSPPGALSPSQMDAITDLAYEILTIQKEMREILSAAG
ncbi:MAG: hypothetical protein WCD75_11100 [Rhodoplanes sp.]